MKIRHIAVVVVFILGFILWQNRQLIGYGYEQAEGQLKIIWNTREVTEVLADPLISDTIKLKIRLIQEVKQFAEDSLGLLKSNNYTTYYFHGQSELMWVISACEPYRLKEKKWYFPVIGQFQYKGFFNEKRAKMELEELKNDGYDTYIRNASGWSTLGLLRDPILSGMLDRDAGGLAELIIHEMTHRTIFIKDSLEFNENIATFTGIEGAKRFLAFRFGMDSEELSYYNVRKKDSDLYTRRMVNACARLDSLYSTFEHQDSGKMYLQKQNMIINIIQELKKAGFSEGSPYVNYFDHYMPNNAFFTAFMVYRGGQDQFSKELSGEFNGDLKSYLSYLFTKHS